MSDSLSNLILSLTPDDGSTMGNGAMMALLREQEPGLTDDDYTAIVTNHAKAAVREPVDQ